MDINQTVKRLFVKSVGLLQYISLFRWLFNLIFKRISTVFLCFVFVSVTLYRNWKFLNLLCASIWLFLDFTSQTSLHTPPKKRRYFVVFIHERTSSNVVASPLLWLTVEITLQRENKNHILINQIKFFFLFKLFN